MSFLRKVRLGLQAKVLIPLIGFLVLIPAITLWVFSSRMQQQMEDEARRTLGTADSVFIKSLENRSRNYLVHYSSIAGEARFKVTARLGDRKTTEALLGELLENAPEDHEALMLYNSQGELISGRRRSAAMDLDKLGQAAAGVVRDALSGTAAHAQSGRRRPRVHRRGSSGRRSK